MSIRLAHLLFMSVLGRYWLPRRAQLALRRRRFRRVLSTVRDRWPIDERAAAAPRNWPGWPGGKRCAIVVTHDVDTRRGVARCRELMDIEESLGFRSAFYFVPRGRYPMPRELMVEMTARGFEVGVHGWYHDWWTFTSRRVFERRAPLIRQVMREWGAVGFRAPSMVSNLDWIRELDVTYDASSFDTDPFEPQPDGLGTVFPLWVDGDGCHPGYVELPYTLPQDFTLFVIQQEASIDIWKRKLEWLLAKGGMALLNTHPDYMSFGSSAPGHDEYPVARYLEFLQHVRANYGTSAWMPLPRSVACFYRQVVNPGERVEPCTGAKAPCLVDRQPA